MDSICELKDHVRISINYGTNEIGITLDAEATKFLVDKKNSPETPIYELESIADELLVLAFDEMRKRVSK